MTRQEIADHQARQRAFRETPAGSAFLKSEGALGNAWIVDQNPNSSDARLTKAWDASNAAREALIAEIGRLQLENDAARAPAKAEGRADV